MDWESLGLRSPQVSDFPDIGDIKAHQLCSPSIPGDLRAPSWFQKPCQIQNFCSDDAVPWCYVDTGSDSSACHVATGGWGFCQKQRTREVTFKVVSMGAILAHELRKNVRCTVNSPITQLATLKNSIRWIDRQVSKTYICDERYVNPTSGHQPPYNILPWSQLLGFQEPNETARSAFGETEWEAWKTAAGISTRCNGLSIANDKHGSYCVVNSSADFDKMMAFAVALNHTPTYPELKLISDISRRKFFEKVATDWFGIVLVWSSPRVHGTGPNDPPTACEDRCRKDPDCKAFIASRYQADLMYASWETDATATPGDQTTTTPPVQTLAPYTCMLYGETWPYVIYKYNRTSNPAAWATSPITPLLRMFNFDYSSDPYGINNAYINTFLPVSSIYGLAGGPYANRSLILAECKAICVATSGCTSIAFPGCYLFNSNVNWTQQTPNDNRKTEVWIKSYTSLKVHRVAGAPEVYAYSDNINGGDVARGVTDAADESEVTDRSYSSESLLNKPAGCAFNSKGDLFFADTWNHRIRKIEKMHVDCQYNMDLFTEEAVNHYRNLINNMNSKCFTNATAPFLNASAGMQQQVVQMRQMTYLAGNLCQFPSAGAKSLPTQNLLVLCTVCNETNNRADLQGCPSEALCECREAIVKALSSEVYLNCPSASAYYDKWHRFITSYVTCWFSQGVDDAHYLTDVGKQTLKNALRLSSAAASNG